MTDSPTQRAERALAKAASTPQEVRDARAKLDATPLDQARFGIYVDGQIISMGTTAKGNAEAAKWWKDALGSQRVTTRRRKPDDEVWGERTAAQRGVADLDAEIAALQAADAEDRRRVVA